MSNAEHKRIAERLREVAKDYPDRDPGGWVEKVVVLTHDKLVIKCLPYRSCVLSVADKYQKTRVKVASRKTARPTLKRSKFSQTVLKRFCADNDWANAVAYCKSYGEEVVFTNGGRYNSHCVLVDLEYVDFGIVVGRFHTMHGRLSDWTVTHIDTGLSVATASSKADAIEQYQQLDPEKISKGIRRHARHAGFQERALQEVMK